MDAEKQKTVSEEEHMRRAEAFQAAETEVQRLEKRLKSHIAKTRPYFEQKDVFNKALESQKLRVHDLQQKVLPDLCAKFEVASRPCHDLQAYNSGW